MPTISTRRAFNNCLRIVTVSGTISVQDIRKHIHDPESSEEIRLCLWNFQSGALKFECQESWGLPRTGQPPVARGQLPAKTALFCPNELDHGLFRILREFVFFLQFPAQVRVFRNFQAARRWLELCRHCLHGLSAQNAQAQCFSLFCSTLCFETVHPPRPQAP